MRTIGVIADTHGVLRPRAREALEGSHLILHAGDVGSEAVLAGLGGIAPMRAVYGNTDYGALRDALPRTVVIDLGSEDGDLGPGGAVGPLAYVHHGDQELDIDPAAAGIALVVSGHTHKPLVEERAGVVYLNPGSAGPRRYDLPATVARVRVRTPGEDGPPLQVEIVPVGMD